MFILTVSCAILWSLESLVPLYKVRDRQRFRNLALTAIVLLTNLAFSFVTARIAAIHVSAPPLIVAILALDLSTTPRTWRCTNPRSRGAFIACTTPTRTST